MVIACTTERNVKYVKQSEMICIMLLEVELANQVGYRENKEEFIK